MKLNPYFKNDSAYFLIYCDLLFELEIGLCSIFSSSINFTTNPVLRPAGGKLGELKHNDKVH